MKRALLLAFTLLVVVPFHARAAEELTPPFGFRWSFPMSRVENVLNAAHARITNREKKDNRDVWTVEGLVHPGLKRTLFTFHNGVLAEVELQYEYERGIEWYNERIHEIRTYFDGKYGIGKLVARPRDPRLNEETDVVQTLVGYQWPVGSTMLELFYFSAQSGQNVFRTISVHYRSLQL
jgi:hypothetical protein